MRKDKDLVQMGIVVKPELREWFVNKCSLARTNEDRIVSISTILGYYLEKLKELDELDPFNTCPILKRDESSPRDSLETSPVVDWTIIVNPIKEQIKHLSAKFNETIDYEQKLALLESRLTNTIDDKIAELFSRLQSEELLKPIAITSNSAVKLDETITPILRRLEQLELYYQQSTSNLDTDLLDDLKDDSDNEAVVSQEEKELEVPKDDEVIPTQFESVTKIEIMTKAKMARLLKVSATTVSNWVIQGKWSKFPSDWEWNLVREHFERKVTFAAPDNSP